MSTALIFPGQGAQYVGMGQSLYDNNHPARMIFFSAEDVLGSDFLQVCFSGPSTLLTQTKFCQPALFLHGCAAIAILREMNMLNRCDLAYGLSLGELTALWAAEVYDFKTGFKIVAERGRLMQKACEDTHGSMLCLINGTEDDIQSLCREADVEIANRNCPGQIVVSGEKKNIERAKEIAAKMQFKRVLPLNVAGAYHSRLMESAAIEFEKFLQDIEFYPPKIKVLTNVTGGSVETPQEIKKMLVKQITAPVLFEKCCNTATELGTSQYFECGPGKTLNGLLKKIHQTVIVRNFDKIEDFEF